MAAKLRVKYDAANPLTTGLGLADPAGALKALADAADACIKTYGSLDVKWGDVFRFGSGTGDQPGNGGSGNSGVFRTVAYTRKDGNRYFAAHGETFVCVVEPMELAPQPHLHRESAPTALPGFQSAL